MHQPLNRLFIMILNPFTHGCQQVENAAWLMRECRTCLARLWASFTRPAGDGSPLAHLAATCSFKWGSPRTGSPDAAWYNATRGVLSAKVIPFSLSAASILRYASARISNCLPGGVCTLQRNIFTLGSMR